MVTRNMAPMPTSFSGSSLNADPGNRLHHPLAVRSGVPGSLVPARKDNDRGNRRYSPCLHPRAVPRQASDNALRNFQVLNRLLIVSRHDKILPSARTTRKTHCAENRIDGEQKCPAYSTEHWARMQASAECRGLDDEVVLPGGVRVPGGNSSSRVWGVSAVRARTCNWSAGTSRPRCCPAPDNK